MNIPNIRNPKRSYSYLFYSRRISQLLFLAVFIFLFIRTDYSGADRLEYVVNILFRLDPYLAAATMLAGRTLIALMLPSLGVVILTLILGRSFCGWFCPMGTLLDGARKGLPTDRKGRTTLYPRLAKWLLLTTILLALCGFHASGYFDPFSILVRGLAQAVYPAFHGITEGLFTFTYTSAPSFINAVTEPIYAWLRDHMLPAERKFFELVYLSTVILGLVFIVEIAQKRFYCRNICPLGALLGLVSAWGLLRGRGGSDKCGKCRICSSVCRMGAIDESRQIDSSTCNLCFECTVKCPKQIISFGFGVSRVPQRQHQLQRRHFLGILATGVLLPAVSGASVTKKYGDSLLIRPPGALIEKDFIARCVRCGECYQVCIGNALQPALLEGGLDAIFSPKLVARTGYCEFNCTLCGQVCPTGAIREIDMAEKHRLKIGNAWFDKNRCLPYAKNISCIVCEEHCPTAEKAIQFKDVEVEDELRGTLSIKHPYVVDDLCIGCGICEYKCPLPGRSAIIVTNANESRDPEKALPQPSALPYG